jgi:hypothetical protein
LEVSAMVRVEVSAIVRVEVSAMVRVEVSAMGGRRENSPGIHFPRVSGTREVEMKVIKDS